MEDLRDITQSCRIHIDKDGRWFYEGSEIIHQYVLNIFYNALEQDEYGRYRIVIGPEVCYVDVEDTPFVVSAISGDTNHGYYITLNNSKIYKLDPLQLWIGDSNVLYARLPNGMKVRFSRPAYYDLALKMEEDETGDIVLKVSGQTYKIYSVDRRGE
ncbi:MAG: DUF1285 domain-containing protein [Deltaproteobacteria bacterium]|nr:DUF1285 domain-containing protein [Deltaproteobacteria bacterium]